MNTIHTDHHATADSHDTREHSSFVSWLRDMFTEKGTDVDAPVDAFEEVGHIGLTYGMVFDFLNQLLREQQAAIRTNLVKLDFANADVFDYLNHLTNGMIKVTGMDQFAGFVKTKHGHDFN